MKFFTAAQSQKLDTLVIDGLGIPSIVLMENAGRLAAEACAKILKKAEGKRVCVFCGQGNNGGDGFVVARHLFNEGLKVKVFLIGSIAKLKNDPLLNYKILKKLKCPIKSIKGVNFEVLRNIKKSELIVDAIFGIGLNRDIGEPYKGIIESINKAKKKVVAVDVPSGLDSTTGKIFGVCVKATQTITFAVLKKGFSKNQGTKFSGRVVVADIGIPKALWKKV
ncbi:MAG: NAD(P)H-hydrate epimerase [Candidatus Aceula meridiana]|nr:NAD(P)H-hydrate epimerase [Candidatus Aceula meridiana]